AQLVEQGIENPRVGGSIPSPATIDETVWTSNPPGAGFFAPGPRGGAASRVRGRSGRAPAGPGRAPGPRVAYAIVVAMRQPVRAAGGGAAGPVLRTNRGVQSVSDHVVLNAGGKSVELAVLKPTLGNDC